MSLLVIVAAAALTESLRTLELSKRRADMELASADKALAGAGVDQAKARAEDLQRKAARRAAELGKQFDAASADAKQKLDASNATRDAAKAAESTVLRVAVGSVDKCVEARVPSRFSPDGQLDAAAPTLRMPLRYEVGPLGLDNPVGIDPTLYDEVSGSYRVPQLLPPDVAAKPGVSVPFTGSTA